MEDQINSQLLECIEPEIAALGATGRRSWDPVDIDVALLASIPSVQEILAELDPVGQVDLDVQLKAVESALKMAIQTLPSRYCAAALEHFGYTDQRPDESYSKGERERRAAKRLGKGERWYRDPSKKYFGLTPADYVIALVASAFCGITNPIAYIARREGSDTGAVLAGPRSDDNGDFKPVVDRSNITDATGVGLQCPSATMVSRDPEHLEVFWTGPNNEVFYRWWLQSKGWSEVESWAEPEAVYLAAVSQEDGDEVLFGLAPNGRVWYRAWEIDHRGWHIAGEVHWLDGVVRGPLTVASRGLGMIELFAFDAQGQPCHRRTDEGMEWSAWTSDW